MPAARANPDPKSRVAGVLLAAGRSTRMGGDRPKQLAELGGGPLVRRAAETALVSRLAEVVVVLGHRAEEVASALDGLAVTTVTNPDHRRGQSTSVRAGVAALGPEVDAALFLLADQPLLTPPILDRLIAAFEETGGPIVVPTHGGRRRAPALFARPLFEELAGLRGDAGGRKLMPRHAGEIVTVEIEDGRHLADVDTEEQLRALEALPELEPADTYLDQDGLMVFTRHYHLKRGYCCKSGCLHCPWGYRRRIGV